MTMAVWSGERVSKFVEQPPDVKVNPNGVDIKVAEVFYIDSDACSVVNGDVRETTPGKTRVRPEKDGFYHLKTGVYEIRLANRITIPKDAVAFFFPRSTLNRLGMIKSQTAVGDSGYSGYPTQTVFIPIKDFMIHKDEHWIQVMFMGCEESANSYSGRYQGERPLAK